MLTATGPSERFDLDDLASSLHLHPPSPPPPASLLSAALSSSHSSLVFNWAPQGHVPN